MQKILPIVALILPLLVAAIAFKWAPNSELLGPWVIGSILLGWIALGFSATRRFWLKVVMLVSYPLVMWIAITIVMVVVYGVPGL